ncbi:hypothetical protein JTB14_021244 [Gonioctena quinquepunctata]|nr:hypothetical protein JTB14_021244 [Gonioctena quinquepunctata]
MSKTRQPKRRFRVSNEGVILVTDDDSDQEPGGREYGQYQPLPSSPIEESTDTSDEDRENEVVSSSDSHSATQIPPIHHGKSCKKFVVLSNSDSNEQEKLT